MSEMITEKMTSEESHPLLFDHYEVLRVLGRGAMGVVYLAKDIRIGRLAALKTLKSDQLPDPSDDTAEEFLNRFKREAEVCGSLVHPNIVTLYEVGYANRQVRYLAMEYVEGESLQTLLRRRGRLEIPLACRIILDILEALDYAHERKVIHRDIKPANVLVTSRGHAKIADFGVARSVREGISQVTQAGHLLGTPYYMAPEHITGREIDGRVDLFSTGVMLFELLSGQRPFKGDSIMDVLYDVVNRPAPSLQSAAPDLPAWCDRYVSRLLQKDPKDRFLSAGAAAEELERLLDIHKRDSGTSGSIPMLSQLVNRDLTPEETPTAPIHSRRAWLRTVSERVVSRRLAIGIILILSVAAGAPILWMTARVSGESVAVETVPLEQQQELDRKRRMIEEARILLDAGAYDKALERYDAILSEFPDNVSAIKGRQSALTHLYPLDASE